MSGNDAATAFLVCLVRSVLLALQLGAGCAPFLRRYQYECNIWDYEVLLYCAASLTVVV